jgi:hypothetical protein
VSGGAEGGRGSQLQVGRARCRLCPLDRREHRSALCPGRRSQFARPPQRERARKIDEDVLARIRTILGGRPDDHGFERPTWTLEILRAVIAEVVGVLLSVAHVRRLAKRLGARWGRPRPIVACPWNARRRQRRTAALQRLAASLSDAHVVVYADDVDVHLNPTLGPDGMLPGVQRLVLAPGRNGARPRTLFAMGGASAGRAPRAPAGRGRRVSSPSRCSMQNARTELLALGRVSRDAQIERLVDAAIHMRELHAEPVNRGTKSQRESSGRSDERAARICHSRQSESFIPSRRPVYSWRC